MLKHLKLIGIALLFGSLSLQADLIPTSTCSFFDPATTSLGFQCNLYGDASNAVVTVPFPAGWNSNPPNTVVTSGYIVLEDPTADPAANNIVADSHNLYGSSDSNEADWTQILYFSPGVNQPATQVTLYTIGCNNSLNPADVSCFPLYSTIMASAYFDVYTSPDYYYDDNPNPGANIDHLYTVTLVAPEPATYGFAIGGFALMAGLARRRSRQRGAAPQS